MVTFEEIKDGPPAVSDSSFSSGGAAAKDSSLKPKELVDVTPAVPERLPTWGETVEIKGLVSSPRLNWKRGKISAYVDRGRNIHRYKVKLDMGDGTHKILAVKPENVSLLASKEGSNGASVRCDDAFYRCDDWGIAHLLIPCHVWDKRRRDQFDQCVRSLSLQTGRCRVLVGVSGRADLRRHAVGVLRAAAAAEQKGRHHQWIVLEEAGEGETKKSQFEHMRSLLSVSLEVNPSAWLMFLDNDDMFHPERVKFFQENVGKMQKSYPDRKAFCCGAKALINEVLASSKCGPGHVFPLDSFLKGDASLDDIVEVVQTAQENGAKDTMEFFDFCVHPEILKTFVKLSPDEIISHQYCDLRFLDAIITITPPPPYFRHPKHTYLYMHYCIRQEDRQVMFMEQNLEKLKVEISEEDCDFEVETGYKAAKITTLRKGVEECIIQTVFTLEANVQRSRDELCTADEAHKSDIGKLLWESTMKKFESYFTDELAKKNQSWWKKLDSRPVGQTKTKDGFIDRGNGMRVMHMN